MFFADDLILSSKVFTSQVQFIKLVLEDFCGASGHKINKTKTCIFFSYNVPISETCRINTDFNF